MTFYPAHRRVPGGLVTDEFVLTPLTVAHAELDHAALMDSREMLRVWSGTGWPADDFSVEQNRADLDRHEHEHRERIAFTYTVLSPDGAECLGCVYITPLSSLVEHNPDLEDVDPGDAVVGFWVRETRRADQLDHRLLEELLRWFDSDWAFDSIRLSTSAANHQQVELFTAAGLRPWRTVEVPPRAGSFVLFER